MKLRYIVIIGAVVAFGVVTLLTIILVSVFRGTPSLDCVGELPHKTSFIGAPENIYYIPGDRLFRFIGHVKIKNSTNSNSTKYFQMVNYLRRKIYSPMKVEKKGNRMSLLDSGEYHIEYECVKLKLHIVPLTKNNQTDVYLDFDSTQVSCRIPYFYHEAADLYEVSTININPGIYPCQSVGSYNISVDLAYFLFVAFRKN